MFLDCAPLDLDSYTADRQQVVLQGSACDALSAPAPHRIDVVLGCPVDA
ncbi:MAG TPA: hypothetical protein VL137_12040 [Polyangiaceae bacterium]|nr:hypothetical protein [Polyangiaceae bacterium]